MAQREYMKPPEDASLPYWTDDISLCEASVRYFRHAPTTVRAKVHTHEEAYDASDIHEEIVPIKTKQGLRTYILLKPYVLEPEVTLTVGLRSEATDDQAVGDVLSSTWEGMRHKEVGHIQAWHYRADRAIVL